MFTAPEYFSILEDIIPEQQLESMIQIEVSFYKLNYDQHMDAIHLIVQTENDEIAESAAEEVLYTYKEAIAETLGMLGITIIDLIDQSIGDLSNILATTIFIGSPDADIENVDEEDPITYFATHIANVTESAVTDWLPFIESVSDNTIKTIKALHDDSGDLEDGMNTEYIRDRFKLALGEAREGIVFDHVIKTGSVGYGITTVRALYADDIEALEDAEAMGEIRQMVAGSNVSNDSVDYMVGETADYIFDDARAHRLNTNRVDQNE